MKEVMCIIRLNKVNQTKQALVEAGFPSITCRKVVGRGKKAVKSLTDDYSFISEAASEVGRLIPKRLITLIINDEDVKKVVDTVISVNKTGTAGDGKIFVMPVKESYTVRTGEAVL